MERFKRVGLRTKLLLLAVTGLVALSIIAVGSMQSLGDALYKERRASIESLVSATHAIAEHYHDLATRGAMSEAAAQQMAADTIRAMRYGNGDYFWIHGTDLVMRMHAVKPDMEGKPVGEIKDTNGKFLFRDMNRVVESQGRGFVDYSWPKPGEDAPQPKISYVAGYAPWGWVIGTGVYVSDLETAFWQDAARSIGLVIAGFLLVVGGSWWIGRSILHSLGGEPATLAEMVRRIAGGDLTGKIDTRGAKPGSVVASLVTMQQDLRGMIGAVRRQAEHINQVTEAVAGASSTVQMAASQQSEAAESVAAAVEEITVSVGHVADNTGATRANAERTAQAAEEGEHQSSVASEGIADVSGTVAQAAEQIQVLKARSSEIGSIAQVIREIADQTNLLALNAAIEAARAGEQGRGFAVVADEVRSLAERTGTATAQISTVIESVQQETSMAVSSIEAITPKVEHGSTLAAQAAQTLRSIRQSALETQSQVGDVATSMAELSAGAEQIAQNMEAISALAGRSATAVARNAEATAEMEATARELGKLIDRFQV